MEDEVKEMEKALRELEKADAVDRTQLSLLISQVTEFRVDMRGALKEVVDHYDAKMEKLSNSVISKESGGWWLTFGQDIVKYIVFAVIGALLAIVIIKK